MPLSTAAFHVDALMQKRSPGWTLLLRRPAKSRKEAVRVAAMGLLGLHRPVWREGGRDFGVGPEECL